MELFDIITNTLNGAGKDGLNMARDLKDTAKITVEIKEREGAIQRAYRELGKAYYAAHKDDAEFEFTTMQKIKDAFAQIGELQAAKDEIRGIKRCASCGAVIQSTAKFCSECGSAAPVIEPKEDEIFEGDIVDENEEVVAEKCCCEETAEEACCCEEEKAEEACCCEEEKAEEACCCEEEKAEEACCCEEEKAEEACCCEE